MGYECVDRGSDRCPCVLMEAGQCYSCTMIRDGKCSCEEAAGWKGSCPYTEYVQGCRGHSFEYEGEILEKEQYSDTLWVVKISAPEGIIMRCRQPGVFMMAEADGWRTPLSVLRAEERGLEFAVQPVGPKTKWLLKQERWKLTGPYYSGLLGMDRDDWKQDALIIAKGTAAAPFICGRSLFTGNVTLYMDSDKLSDNFIQEYVCGHEDNIQYRAAVLTDEECMERCRNLVKAAAAEGSQRIWLLVSPYYVRELAGNLPKEVRESIIVPNPANMCCGEGVCGACSHTDENGMTVRLCKCVDKW